MNTGYNSFISKLFSEADKKFIPLSGAFELTSRCPLDCKMCYIHKKENDCEAQKLEKNTEWWLKLTGEAKNAGMLMLLLTGGEPLLRDDFDAIYLNAKKSGILVSVNTNGLLIDDERVRFFADNPPQWLNISLYGASEEAYRNLCGNGEAYRKVTDAIKKLKAAGVNVKINYTVTQHNMHDAAKIYEFAKSLDIPVQAADYIFPPVRGGNDAARPSAEAAAKARFEWRRHILGDEDMRKFILYKQSEPCGICGERINCRAALSTFWVTWNGLMTPCGMMATPSVEITDFGKAWQMLKNERQKILLPKECRECSLRKSCDMCAAVSMAECGRSDNVPPYACKKAREYGRICEEFLNGH